MTTKSDTGDSVGVSSPALASVEANSLSSSSDTNNLNNSLKNANKNVNNAADSNNPNTNIKPHQQSPSQDDNHGSFKSINKASTSPSAISSFKPPQPETKKPIIPKESNNNHGVSNNSRPPTITSANTPSTQPKHRNLVKSLPHESQAPSSPNNQAQKTISPSSSSPHSTTLSPWCQNCQTSTTPLWRRDESGQILCNACGLFLKLHGRSRPISLKTDTIKSRNRNKNNTNSSQNHGNSHGNATTTSNSESHSKNSPSTSADGSVKPQRVKSRKKAATTATGTKTRPGSRSTNSSSAKSSPAIGPVTTSDNLSDSATTNSSLKNLYHAENTSTPAPASPAVVPAQATATPSVTKETLPPLMASLEPIPHTSATQATNSQTPYLSWAPSPSFNPLTRSTHLLALNSPISSPFVSSTTVNSLAPLSALTKDGDGNPFSPLRPPMTNANGNPLKSLLSESSYTPSVSHQPPSLKAITSPLLLASTPSSHLHPPVGTSSLLNPPKSYPSASLYQPLNSANKDVTSHPLPPASSKSIPPMSPYATPTSSAGSALDQLTSAACTSPYLSPVPQRSDSKLPSIMSSFDSKQTRIKSSSLDEYHQADNSNSISDIDPSTPKLRAELHGSPTSVDKSQNEFHESSGVNVQVLQTRVSELELVNDLLRSRIAELETSEDSARRSEAIVRESEILLRVRVNKLESKNQGYVKRIKTLRKTLLAMNSEGRNNIASSSQDTFDGLLEDELDFTDSDEQIISNAKHQASLVHNNKNSNDHSVANEANHTKTVMMMLQNGNRSANLDNEGGQMPTEGSKPSRPLTWSEEQPFKKFKTDN